METSSPGETNSPPSRGWKRRCPGGVVLLAVLVEAAVIPSHAVAQDLFANAKRLIAGASDCPEEPTLRAAEGGGTFALNGKDQIRIPYGVRFNFVHRVDSADAVYLVLREEGKPDVRLTTGTGSAPLTCYQAPLPDLGKDHAVTLEETVIRRPTEAQRSRALGAVDSLRQTFLQELFNGRWEAAAREHRLPEAVAKDFGGLTDTAAFSDLAVPAGSGGHITWLSDSVRSLFKNTAPNLIALPDSIQSWQGMLSNLAAAAHGDGVCRAAGTSPEVRQARIALDRFLGSMADLVSASSVENVVTLYQGHLLPLKRVNPDTMQARFLLACGGTNPSLKVQRIGGIVRAAVEGMAFDPVTPFTQAAEAARRAVRNSYRLTAVDAFGGFTTTLQRFGQLDVVNAYIFELDEARVLATFSLYPFRQRYGAERQPHSWADKIVITVGYSVATTVKGNAAAADRGLFTLGLGLRLNPTMSLGGGGAFSGGNAYWYGSLSLDLGSIPGLEQLFARK